MLETCHYVNIFALKGVEYLLLVGFLIMLVFFVRYLTKTNE